MHRKARCLTHHLRGLDKAVETVLQWGGNTSVCKLFRFYKWEAFNHLLSLLKWPIRVLCCQRVCTCVCAWACMACSGLTCLPRSACSAAWRAWGGSSWRPGAAFGTRGQFSWSRQTALSPPALEPVWGRSAASSWGPEHSACESLGHAPATGLTSGREPALTPLEVAERPAWRTSPQSSAAARPPPGTCWPASWSRPARGARRSCRFACSSARRSGRWGTARWAWWSVGCWGSYWLRALLPLCPGKESRWLCTGTPAPVLVQQRSSPGGPGYWWAWH